MRIYSNPYELMSETARNLWEMGNEVKPRTYQNKVIEGNDDFITKELICEQYCLTHLEDPAALFVFTKSKDWAEAEFEERVCGRMENPGKAWELRKNVWEEFLVGGFFDYTYAERMNETVSYKGKAFSKLEAVIELLRNDNDTRKAILNIYGEVGFERSSDFVTHFGNDVYLAWRLMEYVASEVGIKPGYLYHTIDSLHSYKKDWVKLKTSIQIELR